MEELDRLDTLVDALGRLNEERTELIKEYSQAKKAELIKEKHGHYYMLAKLRGRHGYYMLMRNDGVLEIDGPTQRIRKWCDRKGILLEQILVSNDS